MIGQSIAGGASWGVLPTSAQTSEIVYNNSGTNFRNRALAYSAQAYQSDGGFQLKVNYTTGNIGDNAGHNLSFGLISDETNLSTYDHFNPFRAEPSVYSIGVNLTTDGDASARGLNFTNGTSRRTLDSSGTNAQFVTNQSTEVVMEIRATGDWSYSINGVVEATGFLPEGFDTTKSYHIVVYGQDDNGGGKSLQGIELTNLEPLTHYQAWLGQYGAGISQGTAADPDGDGLSNLLEFVLDGDPTANTGEDSFPRLDFSSVNPNYQFRQRLDSLAEVETVIEYSEDLEVWEDVIENPNLILTQQAISNELEAVTVDLSPAVDRKLFFRLKASVRAGNE